MIPHTFPEANSVFGPPNGIEESQVQPIPAYVGQVVGGSLDGVQQVVVAWQPATEEIELIRQGKPIFLSFLSGGLPPHYLSMDFHTATHPS